MRPRTLIRTALSGVFAVLALTGPAWAGAVVPGPGGALGLVALGVIGAIVIAKLWRQK